MHAIPAAHNYYQFTMPDQEIRQIILNAPKWDGNEGLERNTADLLCEALSMAKAPKHLQISGAQADFFCDHALDVALTARAYRLDPWIFAALGTTESRWSPKAVSPKGACGLYQVMPHKGYPSCATMKKNHRQAILAGGKALRMWLDFCEGDLECGLRSYNGGTRGPKMKDTAGFYRDIVDLTMRYKSVFERDLPTT